MGSPDCRGDCSAFSRPPSLVATTGAAGFGDLRASGDDGAVVSGLRPPRTRTFPGHLKLPAPPRGSGGPGRKSAEINPL